MKKKLDKQSYKAIMVVIPKHHSNDNYYMYNDETRRIIISRDVRWAPFTRLSFYEGLDEVIRPDANREGQDENIQQVDEDEEENESNPERDINLGGRNDLDNMEDKIEEITRPQGRGSRMIHELKTNLNSEYFTPRHATRRRTDNDEINILEDEQVESNNIRSKYTIEHGRSIERKRKGCKEKISRVRNQQFYKEKFVGKGF